MNLLPAVNGWFCPEDPGEPGGSKRWSVNDSEARVISELCHERNVLEIGTGLGVSTKAIAGRAKKVYTVDVDEWVRNTVVPELPENVEFFSDIRQVPRNLDVAFIDGLHTHEQVLKDIKDARHHVKKDGIFIFHDGKIRGVFKAIADSNFHAVCMITTMGIVLAWNA